MTAARMWMPAIGAALLVAACGSDHEDPLGSGYQALSASEEDHFARMNELAEPGAMRAECAAYADRMGRHMGDLGTACRQEMDAGRLGRSDYDRWGDVMGRMGDRIEEHRRSCTALGGVVELRNEARRHHDEMGPLLDEMGERMEAGGRMRGGDHRGGMR